MIRRLFCWLGFHGATVRHTLTETRLLICVECGRTVYESPRMPDCGPASESMKAKRVESRDVLRKIKG